MSLDAISQQMTSGGWVMIPLGLCLLGLWYSVGFRHFNFLSVQKDLLASVSELAKDKETGWRGDLTCVTGLTKTIVIVAPLLGLLGTVSGMIETFSSLAEMKMYSSTGGIAGGISQALLTTQLGLIITIPGVFAHRMLIRKEEALLGKIHGLASECSKAVNVKGMA